ncbi:DUF1127 domain-containing protein [Bradyrhizobium sp. 14AA]
MSITHGTTWLERTSVSISHVASFIWKCLDAFQERRERQKLRVTLSNLSDRELMDIGTTRGEIDFVASGMRCDEWLRYRPTVDGHIGLIDFR